MHFDTHPFDTQSSNIHFFPCCFQLFIFFFWLPYTWGCHCPTRSWPIRHFWLATSVFNMWLLLANIPRLLVAVTTIITRVIVPSCLDPGWYTWSTSRFMIAICQYVGSSIDHPSLMPSKVLPKTILIGMACSAPHTRKKNRNCIKPGKYMQLHQVSTCINPIATLHNQCNTRIHQVSSPDRNAPNTPGGKLG